MTTMAAKSNRPIVCSWAVICPKSTSTDEAEINLKKLWAILRIFRLRRPLILGRSNNSSSSRSSFRGRRRVFSKKVWKLLSQAISPKLIILRLRGRAIESSFSTWYFYPIKGAVKYMTWKLGRSRKMTNSFLLTNPAKRFWSWYLDFWNRIMGRPRMNSNFIWFREHLQHSWLISMKDIIKAIWFAWMNRLRPSRSPSPRK